MEKSLIPRRLGARIYLELMPLVSDYDTALTISQELVSFLENHLAQDASHLVEVATPFLHQKIGTKILDLSKSKILAKILITDYLNYKVT